VIGLRVDMRELDRRLKDMASRVGDWTPVVRDFGAHMVRAWSLAFARTPGHTSGPAGKPPAVQGGDLMGSLTYEVRRGGDVLEAGSSARHAAIQHFGGTIRPRKAKALAIPISSKSYGKRPRDFGDLVFIPSKGRGIGVLARESSGGAVEALFALARSVKLPPRPWLLISDADARYLGDRMAEHAGESTA